MARRGPKVEVYRRADDRWAWRALARNNRVVGSDASQGYERLGDAVHMAEFVTGVVPTITDGPPAGTGAAMALAAAEARGDA